MPKIHPRTRSYVKPGTPVVIRDAMGVKHQRIAVTGIEWGDSFLVVRVARPEEIEAAERERREPDAVPWPAEDVWLPGDEPGEDATDAG